MKILFVTSEASPFAASGGLGDVMGALPKEIVKADDNVTAEVIMPYHSAIKEEYKAKFKKEIDISFRLGWRNTGASVYSYTLSGVRYLFVENEYYFNRGRLYGEFDDAERYAFFSMAVVEYMLQSGNIPDVLHANDWQSALAVIYLKTEYAHFDALKSVRTVYTIHNIEYQGKFDPYILSDVFALDSQHYSLVEFDGCINLMKGAIEATDYITTVSPNYACELQYDFFAFGLNEIIAKNSHKMRGVINGIDYDTFSPTVKDIYKTYTKRTVKSGKAANKAALCTELGLDCNPDIPLLVMITRLASQKGIDLLLHIAEELLEKRIQLVVLGTGEEEYENALMHLANTHNNLCALIKFDRVLSKRLYAAADIFLMPSKSEPCGLAQMISCSYGTVPIVRNVGGLADSIVGYDAPGSNGFKFDNYNAHELLYAIERALVLYDDKKEWAELRKRNINCDFSWKNSALNYIDIYKYLIDWQVKNG